MWFTADWVDLAVTEKSIFKKQYFFPSGKKCYQYWKAGALQTRGNLFVIWKMYLMAKVTQCGKIGNVIPILPWSSPNSSGTWNVRYMAFKRRKTHPCQGLLIKLFTDEVFFFLS